MGGGWGTHTEVGEPGVAPLRCWGRVRVCVRAPFLPGSLTLGGEKWDPPPPSPQPYRALLVCTNRALWGCSALLGESWAKGGVCVVVVGSIHPGGVSVAWGGVKFFSFILIHWINSALIEPLCPQSSAGWGVRGEVPEAAVGEAGGSAVGLRRGGGGIPEPFGAGAAPCVPSHTPITTASTATLETPVPPCSYFIYCCL